VQSQAALTNVNPLFGLPRYRFRGFSAEVRPMSTKDSSPAGAGDQDEPIPFMQRLLDNPLLLLFIGVASPTLLYTLWGVMEVVAVPLAK
jgi:hypothetical protein